MDPIKNIKLRWLHGVLHDLTSELSRLQFSRFAPQAWEPVINAYRCEKSIRICVDLAGVDRALIDLNVEPRRVVIRGTRELPEPTDDEGCALQLLAMEIDYGPFIREVPLPAEVEIEQAHAERSFQFVGCSVDCLPQRCRFMADDHRLPTCKPGFE